MKFKTYILPVFICSKLFSQIDGDSFPDFQFGLTHSIFSSICLKQNQSNIRNQEQGQVPPKS